MHEWDLLQAIYHARPRATRAYHPTPPPIAELTAEFGDVAPFLGELFYMAENYNGQALSAAHYLERNCYYLPAEMSRRLRLMAAQGVLEATGVADTFRISEKGERLLARADDLLRARRSLPPAEGAALETVLALLPRAVTATRSGTMPCATWSVDTRARYGRRVGAGEPPLHRLNEMTFDLWAYRDDAHLAAWRPVYSDLAPRDWEALTYVWRGEARDAATLAEALQEHGFSADDYAQSLAGLAARGWVSTDGDGYAVTDAGKDVREQAEAQTDAYFYAAFAGYSAAERAAERADLNAALEGVRAALEAMDR